MHANFSSSVSSWQSFYMLAGTASATLIGLLFVAISLHIDVIGEGDASAIVPLARRTFTRFILVVVIALLFMVPRQDPAGLGLPLLAFGIVDVLRSLHVGSTVLGAHRDRNLGGGVATLIGLPVALPLASGIGLTLIAATLITGTTEYLYWMVPVIGVMLTNAATNAWDLMLGLARYKVNQAGATDRPSVAAGGDQTSEEWLARSR